MSNPSGPDHDPDAAGENADETSAEEQGEEFERRFTAPSAFDAGFTQKIETPPEPATEIISLPPDAAGPATTEPLPTPRTASPQAIPGRKGTKPTRAGRQNSWGWVVAVLLVIAALVAVAVLGTVWLTRDDTAKAAAQPAVTDRPAQCRSLQASITRAVIPASAFFR
jgi:hypothetical protein